MRRGAGKNKRSKVEEDEVVEDQDEVEPKTEENGDDADYVADDAGSVKDEVSDDEGDDETPKKGKKKTPAKKGGKSKKGKKGGKSPKKAAAPAESDEEEYEVESVVDQRFIHGKRQFKVRWRGHGPEEDSWCKEADLHCETLIREYLDQEGEANGGGKKKVGRKRKAEKEEEDDDDEDDETEYEVKEVLEVKFNKNGTREFLIRWKGFTAKDDTWEPESHLSCTDLIEKLMSRVDKAKGLSDHELRLKPKQTDRFIYKAPQGRSSHRLSKSGRRVTYHDFLD